jgi:hypothetical protein
VPAQKYHDGTAIGSQQADCHRLLAVLQNWHVRLLLERGLGRCLFLQLPEAIQILSSGQKRTRQHDGSDGLALVSRGGGAGDVTASDSLWCLCDLKPNLCLSLLAAVLTLPPE